MRPRQRLSLPRRSIQSGPSSPSGQASSKSRGGGGRPKGQLCRKRGGPEKELVIRLCSTAPLASPRLRRPGPHFTVSRHEGGASSLGFPTRLSQSRRASAAAATSPPSHRNARPIEAWTACCIAAFPKGKTMDADRHSKGKPDLLAQPPASTAPSGHVQADDLLKDTE